MCHSFFPGFGIKMDAMTDQGSVEFEENSILLGHFSSSPLRLNFLFYLSIYVFIFYLIFFGYLCFMGYLYNDLKKKKGNNVVEFH